jgi:hypothetical protein
MKKTLLLSLSIAALALAGCGQNVEKIQEHYAKKTPVPVESFDGYLASISKEEIKNIKEYTRSNRLPRSLSIEDDLSVPELPKLDFESDEYEDAQRIRKEMLVVLEKVKVDAKKTSDGIVASYNTKNAVIQAEIVNTESEYAKYTDLIAKEQSNYDTVDATLSSHKQNQKTIQSEFLKELREAIISEGIAVDASTKFIINKQYRRSRSERSCNRIDDSPKENLEVKSEGCIYVTKNKNKPKIEEIILRHGLKFENSNVKESLAYNQRKVASKALNDAKIIAKNQTGINTRSIERDIERLKRKLTSSESSMGYETDIARITRNTLRENEKAKALEGEYREAVGKYSSAVTKEAFKNADINFDTFSDEDEAFKSIGDAITLILYVFTSENGSQEIGITSSEKQGETYAKLFEGRVKFITPKTTVDNEEDLREVLAVLI